MGLAADLRALIVLERMRYRFVGPTANERVEAPLPAPCVVDAALPTWRPLRTTATS